MEEALRAPAGPRRRQERAPQGEAFAPLTLIWVYRRPGF